MQLMKIGKTYYILDHVVKVEPLGGEAVMLTFDVTCEREDTVSGLIMEPLTQILADDDAEEALEWLDALVVDPVLGPLVKSAEVQGMCGSVVEKCEQALRSISDACERPLPVDTAWTQDFCPEERAALKNTMFLVVEADKAEINQVVAAIVNQFASGQPIRTFTEFGRRCRELLKIVRSAESPSPFGSN